MPLKSCGIGPFFCLICLGVSIDTQRAVLKRSVVVYGPATPRRPRTTRWRRSHGGGGGVSLGRETPQHATNLKMF
jgi:hypothetical protein